jgi:hypothetical protein
MWAGYVACIIKMRNAEKLKKPRGISELKGKIRDKSKGIVLEMCYQEADWNRCIRYTVFRRFITYAVATE